jgi:DNA-binding transcriptional MerR regulator
MQNFTIRDIEHLTGIKAHTLRIWEQRYGFFTPKRKESQHRIYDNEDLKQLLHVAFLYHSGWKVSKIASLDPEQMAAIVRETTVGEEDYQLFIHQLLQAALDFNEYQFLAVINSITERIGFEKCIVDVCYPYLIKIGHLWSTNNIIPAQEHFSSYIIQNRIIVETEKVSSDRHAKPEILLLCPRGEFHELPLLFINYLLRKYGWGTVYMGTNVQLEEVDLLIRQNEIKTLYMHLITNFTGFEVDDYFEKICKRYPDRQIVASGGGVHKAQRSFVNLNILRTDTQIYQFIQHRQLQKA